MRDRAFELRLQNIPKRDREWWVELYIELMQAEMDRDWFESLVDGTHPCANTIIKIRRARVAEESEEDQK